MSSTDATATELDGPVAQPPPAPPPQPPAGLHHRLRTAVAAHTAELPRFVTERPPSLAEHLDYARRGEWSHQIEGPSRRAHLAYTRLVAIPVTAVALSVVWAVARPGRAIPIALVACLFATALNTLPVAGWLIPDALTFTAWPPFTWFGG